MWLHINLGLIDNEFTFLFKALLVNFACFEIERLRGREATTIHVPAYRIMSKTKITQLVTY